MAYRDELTAALARVAALERENAELRQGRKVPADEAPDAQGSRISSRGETGQPRALVPPSAQARFRAPPPSSLQEEALRRLVPEYASAQRPLLQPPAPRESGLIPVDAYNRMLPPVSTQEMNGPARPPRPGPAHDLAGVLCPRCFRLREEAQMRYGTGALPYAREVFCPRCLWRDWKRE